MKSQIVVMVATLIHRTAPSEIAGKYLTSNTELAVRTRIRAIRKTNKTTLIRVHMLADRVDLTKFTLA